MDELLMLTRVAQARRRSALHVLSIALVAAVAGCGGGDDSASEEDKAADVAKQYVHSNANNEDAKCAETLASGVDKKLCGDGAPLATRVNPEAKETEINGSQAKVTVTGAATALLDITLVKQGDDWKVKSWRGYAPGDSGGGSGESDPGPRGGY
jgi:hypothetical protein